MPFGTVTRSFPPPTAPPITWNAGSILGLMWADDLLWINDQLNGQVIPFDVPSQAAVMAIPVSPVRNLCGDAWRGGKQFIGLAAGLISLVEFTDMVAAGPSRNIIADAGMVGACVVGDSVVVLHSNGHVSTWGQTTQNSYLLVSSTALPTATYYRGLATDGAFFYCATSAAGGGPMLVKLDAQTTTVVATAGLAGIAAAIDGLTFNGHTFYLGVGGNVDLIYEVSAY